MCPSVFFLCSFIELYHVIASLNHILEYDLNLAIVIAKHVKFLIKDIAYIKIYVFLIVTVQNLL